MIMRTRQNDYGRIIQYTITDENGTAINLSNASTVTLVLGRFGENSNECSVEATVSDAENGIVQFSFSDGDLGNTGYFDAHFTIDWSDGDHETLSPFTVHVLPDL
jgi:hypothetical protein